MKRTAERALANLEMRVANLEKSNHQRWIDVGFKTKETKRYRIRDLEKLEVMIFSLLFEGLDPVLIFKREVGRIETSLSRPLGRIIKALQQSGRPFEVELGAGTNLVKESGSEEVTLTLKGFYLRLNNSPFDAWKDPDSVEVEFLTKQRRFWNEAEPSINHSFRWLHKKQEWKITYNPIRGTLSSNIPTLLKASFAKNLVKHLKDYQENQELILKAFHEEIASWSEDFVKKYGVENFEGLVEDYAESIYRRQGEDEDWAEYGGRESAEKAVWEEVVIVAKKVSGLKEDPERPVFVFLIDFDPSLIHPSKKSVALVKWELTKQESWHAERYAKWGTLEKMRSLYNKS